MSNIVLALIAISFIASGAALCLIIFDLNKDQRRELEHEAWLISCLQTHICRLESEIDRNTIKICELTERIRKLEGNHE